MQKNERYMTDNFPKMSFVGLDGILVQFSQEICENGNSAALAFRQEIEKKNHPYIIAVSYTHLRAHETVLDLVCRLLLEKKKN